ncbi:MAG: hypothetical protein C0467_00730 [Planctomycetaceae bacterium]|nr:hypothetical protein [Planctomycetaceae bacterium]
MRCAAWVLVAVVVTGTVNPAVAQPGPLAPAGGPPQSQSDPDYDPNLPPEPPVGRVVRSSTDRPPNVLGPPVLGAPVRPAERNTNTNTNPEPAWVPPAAPATPATVVPAVASGESAVPVRRASLGAPMATGAPVSARSVEAASRIALASSDAEDPVNDLLTQRSPRRAKDKDREHKTTARDESDERESKKFGDKIGELFGDATDKCKDWFKSDHAFDGFISPVTNPLLFEDPRALTEVRPIFMYQSIPNGQPDFRGGSAYYYGLQGRLAVTDRLSFVFNKLGGVTLSPGSGSAYEGGTGFAELWLGPKYTFLRKEDTGSLMAGGLQFQIPVGSSNVYQDTGSLSLVPYLTYGQTFGRDFKIGSFNTLIGTGFSFATDSVRSDYYYLSAHLDLDVMSKHKFYPLVEMNWLYYTNNGNGLTMGSEGRDLFNFGGQVKNTGMLTAAIGARYKFSECVQLGGAFEFPLAGPKDIFQYRATIDLIWRY